MPLIKSKSKSAFSKNIKTEIAAGKPQKQAVAIAYSVKRMAKKAEGGSLKSVDSEQNPGLAKLPTEVRNKMGYMKKGGMYKKAEGGDVAQDKKMIKKAFSMHDKQQHEDKKTNLSKLKHGGSCKW
jgi:hypothetical protein